jgi:DNA-binding NarL/FixJ family response regulator
MSKWLVLPAADRGIGLAEPATELPLLTRPKSLTSREVEVLELVATGHSNKGIARILTIGEETTKSHIKNIIAKLGARDRTHSVALALQRGLIQLADASAGHPD